MLREKIGIMDFLFGLYQLRLFVFIFAILYIVKYILSVIKVFRLQEGQIDNAPLDLVLLGASISYIITMLITGMS